MGKLSALSEAAGVGTRTLRHARYPTPSGGAVLLASSLLLCTTAGARRSNHARPRKELGAQRGPEEERVVGREPPQLADPCADHAAAGPGERSDTAGRGEDRDPPAEVSRSDRELLSLVFVAHAVRLAPSQVRGTLKPHSTTELTRTSSIPSTRWTDEPASM